MSFEKLAAPTKALLFDFGGTLDSDGAAWIDRFIPLYMEGGLSAERETLCRAFYDSDDNLPRRFALAGLGLEETVRLQVGCVAKTLSMDERAADRVAEAFISDSRRHLRRNRPLLERLAGRFRLGIVSNFYGNLDSVLASEGYSELFAVVSDSEKVGAAKPEARIFQHALSRLGARPEETWMVGDSVKRDMRGAEALGMPHAWVAGTRPETDRCCADAPVLRSLMDIEPLLLGKTWVTCAGIIAAGEGSRLRSSHPSLPKPLVPVRGKPLAHWVAQGLASAGIRSCTMILNSSGQAVRESLSGAFPDIAWDFIVRDTGSSWESFRIVAQALAARSEAFLMSTVDALVPPEDIARFSREAFLLIGRDRPCAALGLTGFVDDEKPLWADMDPAGRITALGPMARRKETVTSGLYALTREAALSMPPVSAHSKLREYWTALVRNGRPVRGVLLSKTVDVDRPEDVAVAEKQTRSWR
ncbi:MAG: HAD-IA family hydrolase [Elusimicrobiota bacterium]